MTLRRSTFSQPIRWLSLVKLWIVYSAVANASGWLLSSIGHLNTGGYLGLALAWPVAAAMGWKLIARHRAALPRPRRRSFRPLLRRFRHPLPAVYLFILIGSLVGGILYAPSNYDMLTYRLPRMLHWLAAGRWHWIHADIDRMNYSGTGWEWAAMPLLLLGRGTRLLFLLNLISYALLPGLLFAFLRSLGVGRRTAWHWMWLLPTGLIFVMQAGGGANDTMGVDFLLAAIVFARRASLAPTPRGNNIAFAIVAAAELTAAKASNLPLLLPCAIALLPALWRQRKRLAGAPLKWSLIALLALSTSIAPLLALNWHYTGDYAGSPGDPGKLKLHHPLIGLLGNSIMIADWNLQPPVMPLANQWNAFTAALVRPSTAATLERDFPRFGLHIGELPQEEGSGLGLAITVLAALAAGATIAATLRRQRRAVAPSPAGPGERRGEGDVEHSTARADKNRPHPDPLPGNKGAGRDIADVAALICGGIIALLAYMSMVGSESAARLIAPHYPLVLAPLLLGRGNNAMARRRWWKWFAVVAAASAIPGLILTPSRPLFPAVRWTTALARRYPHSPAAARAAEVYAVYAARPDSLAPLRRDLPPAEKTIGFLGGGDDSEISLWLPIGSGRRVYDILPTDTPATLAAAGVRYAVISGEALNERHQTLAQALQQIHGTVVADRRIVLKVSEGPREWYVARVGGE